MYSIKNKHIFNQKISFGTYADYANRLSKIICPEIRVNVMSIGGIKRISICLARFEGIL